MKRNRNVVCLPSFKKETRTGLRRGTSVTREVYGDSSKELHEKFTVTFYRRQWVFGPFLWVKESDGSSGSRPVPWVDSPWSWVSD